MISLNTVYKTLNTLRERDALLVAGSSRDGALRFEMNRSPHHHAICLGCRQIRDITDPGLDAIRASSLLTREFAILRHRVEFFGYCADCGTGRGVPAASRRPGRRAK